MTPRNIATDHRNMTSQQRRIPTLDIARFTHPKSAEDRAAFVSELGNAYREWGFAGIRNHGIPQAQLAIFPGATHLIPAEDHELFNRTVERFFNRPFTRPDTKDFFK